MQAFFSSWDLQWPSWVVPGEQLTPKLKVQERGAGCIQRLPAHFFHPVRSASEPAGKLDRSFQPSMGCGLGRSIKQGHMLMIFPDLQITLPIALGTGATESALSPAVYQHARLSMHVVIIMGPRGCWIVTTSSTTQSTPRLSPMCILSKKTGH